MSSMTKVAVGMLEFIAASSALNSRLIQEVNQHRTHKKEAAEKRAAVCDTLISMGAVPVTQKEAALKVLASHSSSLDMLTNAVTRMHGYKQAAERAATSKTAGDLGRAVDQRESGFDHTPSHDANSSLTSPFVGRRTSEKKASDVALSAVLRQPAGR